MRALLVIAALALVVSLPNLVFGPSYGHSQLYNVSWLQAFTPQLQSGILYPRWLDTLNGGAGSLVFFIYAPVPFYVSGLFGPLLCPGCAPTTHLAIGEALLLFASGVAFFAFARLYARTWAAAAGALLYMLAPYHFEIDLWHRQAVGEFAAYVFFPLILLAFRKGQNDPRWLAACAACYALLILSHVPSALLFSLFFGCYALLIAVREKLWRPLVSLAVAVPVGIGLAGVYLLPALQAEGYTGYAAVPYHYYHDVENWLFLDGKDEPDPYIATRLKRILIAVSVIIFLLTVVVARVRREEQRGKVIPWVLAIALVVFMVTPLSLPLWQNVPFLHLVQFPWRIIVNADLALAMMLAIALHELPERRDRIAWGALALAALCIVGIGLSGWRAGLSLPYFMPAEVQAAARAQLAAGVDAPDYLPVWVPPRDRFLETMQALPRLQVGATAGASASAQVAAWRPRDVRVQVSLAQPADVVIKQFYLPEWRVRHSGTGAMLPVSPAPGTGFVRVTAPAGEYELQFVLQTLARERLGQIVSLVALAGLFAIFLFGRRFRPAR